MRYSVQPCIMKIQQSGLTGLPIRTGVPNLFEYFDRADAYLAGEGPAGDEPPKTGVFTKIDAIAEN